MDAIGSVIYLDGRPSRIVGILPSDFDQTLFDADVWQSHTLSPDWQGPRNVRGSGSWFVLGRLAPDVSLQQAQAEMNAVASHLDVRVPLSGFKTAISVTPLANQVTDSRARLALWMLTGAVFCVLLIAATNVASLALARGAAREKEIAIRAALGAGRLRIARQLLAESLTLAVIAGLLGLGIAWAGIRIIQVVRPAQLARLDEIALDPWVLACSSALCLFTGILVGLAPALTMARRNLKPAGLDSRGISRGVAARGVHRSLVVTEFALAFVLLIGAGLLIRSLWSVQSVDPGFRPQRVLSMSLSVPAATLRPGLYRRILEEVEALNGVESAGIISEIFIGGNPERIVTAEEGAQFTSQRLRFRSDEATGGAFRSLGVPLLRGRFFNDADGPDTPRVAIVNNAMAQRVWPDRDAVGRRFKFGPADAAGPWFTVVGVVANMRRQGLETEAIAQMFEPVFQNPSSRLVNLVVRTAFHDPLTLAGAVKAVVHRVDKQTPVYGVNTLESQLELSLAPRRFQTTLLIGFALIALLMAAIGIFGLIQYSISRRTQEIGIRMAIGAQSGAIFRMVLGEGLRLSLTGLAIGLIGAIWFSRAASSLLFGIQASDPLTWVTVSLLLTAVAAAACYFPARRAMKVEPLLALRQE